MSKKGIFLAPRDEFLAPIFLGEKSKNSHLKTKNVKKPL